jgi:hypothetical protein
MKPGGELRLPFFFVGGVVSRESGILRGYLTEGLTRPKKRKRCKTTEGSARGWGQGLKPNTL